MQYVNIGFLKPTTFPTNFRIFAAMSTWPYCIMSLKYHTSSYGCPRQPLRSRPCVTWFWKLLHSDNVAPRSATKKTYIFITFPSSQNQLLHSLKCLDKEDPLQLDQPKPDLHTPLLPQLPHPSTHPPFPTLRLSSLKVQVSLAKWPPLPLVLPLAPPLATPWVQVSPPCLAEALLPQLRLSSSRWLPNSCTTTRNRAERVMLTPERSPDVWRRTMATCKCVISTCSS